MIEQGVEHKNYGMPPLRELGADLARISPLRRVVSLVGPFLWCGAYFAFAVRGWWPPAVFCLVALSFFTYGSISHDLVHRNLALPSAVNDALLCLIELLALRSGHAYRAAHLHHHAHFPHADDIEASAARMSLVGALAQGIVFQPRLMFWALRHAKHARSWIICEVIACLVLVTIAASLAGSSSAFPMYALLMIMGSWIIPLVTSYVPHDPTGTDELTQTRAFRGLVASAIALEHLYHLEHHLYPSVPHHNWARLARRLDPHLERAGVRPIRIWF
ncbi:fatty acid desaturase [Isosphaeraceae bacterium EP7]